MSAARLYAWATARLERKLLIVLGGLLALVSALFLGLVGALYRQQMIAQHAQAAAQVNELLEGTLKNAMLKRDIPGLVHILEGLGTQDGIERVMIVNPDFEVRFSSDEARIGQSLDEPELRAALATQTPGSRYLETDASHSVLRSVNPVKNQPECRECHGLAAEHPVNGLLVVDYRAGSVRSEAISGVLSLGLMGLAVIAAASGAMWLAIRRMVIAPLSGLTAANQALGRGELATRISLRGTDELATLGSAFNRMSGEIAHHLGTISRSGAELQALIDAVPDGLRVIDPNFIIRRANRAFCAQVGLPPERVIGAPCYAVSHGRDTPCPHTLVTCPVVELIEKGGQSVTFRDRHFNASSSTARPHMVEVSSARITLCDPSGATQCVLEAVRDLDSQARISQEERLSEIGLLAAGVAHEIYNPLSSVEFVLSAMGRDLERGRHDRVSEYFETIRSEIGKCIEITDNLLLLSAPPGEGRTLIELERVVQGVFSLLNYQAEQGGIALSADLEPGLRVIAGDSDTRMLLTNLLLNAFHAMPKGGMVSVHGWREAGKVHLAVRDSGVGIAPADIERIFMPFWSRRADASAGRGLGLSIVRAILERHGARIAVDSRLGLGSTFTVTFPDPDAADTGATAAKPQP